MWTLGSARSPTHPATHGLSEPGLSYQLFSFALFCAMESREASLANSGTQIFASQENIPLSVKTQTSWHTWSTDAGGSFYFRGHQACSVSPSPDNPGSFSFLPRLLMRRLTFKVITGPLSHRIRTDLFFLFLFRFPHVISTLNEGLELRIPKARAVPSRAPGWLRWENM